METAIEERTPLWILKQTQVLGVWIIHSLPGEVHWNSAGARDINRRAAPKRTIPAVPPPARKLGFDQSYRSVNRTRHIRGSRGKCTHELTVEFKRANGSGLDFMQKFPQVNLLIIPRGPAPEYVLRCLSALLMNG